MTENMKCFLAKVSEDKALAEKASKLEKDELIVLAKEMGVNLTEADFAQTESDISEGELNRRRQLLLRCGRRWHRW